MNCSVNVFRRGAAVALALVAASTASAASFNFEDPKGVNHIVFMLDAPLEFISGTGKGITGTVAFDPAKPEAVNGEIVLAVESLVVPNATMTEHMHGEKWLNAAENPTIVFAVDGFKVEREDDITLSGVVSGSLTLNGTQREIEVPAKISYIADGVTQRSSGNRKGDLLVVRADFGIKLSDYGIEISPGARMKVSNDVDVKVRLAGLSTQ